MAQEVVLSGHVIEEETDKPVEFASILLTESGQWAITDSKGFFTIKSVNRGKITLTIQCLGFQKRSWPLTVTLTR